MLHSTNLVSWSFAIWISIQNLEFYITWFCFHNRLYAFFILGMHTDSFAAVIYQHRRRQVYMGQKMWMPSVTLDTAFLRFAGGTTPWDSLHNTDGQWHAMDIYTKRKITGDRKRQEAASKLLWHFDWYQVQFQVGNRQLTGKKKSRRSKTPNHERGRLLGTEAQIHWLQAHHFLEAFHITGTILMELEWEGRQFRESTGKPQNEKSQTYLLYLVWRLWFLWPQTADESIWCPIVPSMEVGCGGGKDILIYRFIPQRYISIVVYKKNSCKLYILQFCH